MKAWAEQFYNSDAWRACREGFLQSKGYLCERCSTPDNPVVAKIAHHRTRARFEEIDRVVKLFAERKEFHVIRMYYFGEDAQGNERPTGAEPYTWEAIAAELEGMGLIRDAKSARRWRNKIVNDMAVCMFGKPAAVGVGTYRKERDRG